VDRSILETLKTRNSVIGILEYFVKLKLTYPIFVDALYDYFVNNESPSIIVDRYRISKKALRARIQRIYEYVSPRRSSIHEIVKIVVNAIKDIKPIYTIDNDYATCNLCQLIIYKDFNVLVDHLRRHRDYVDMCMKKALTSLILQFTASNKYMQHNLNK